MYDTHKVKELPLLAKLAKDARFQQEAKLPTLETVQRETILAILLANADFRPYALTREKMASLLSGETAWQDNDGNSLTVQSSITLDALIALGVVSFYNNHCTLNLSSIPDEAHIDNKALVETVTNLHHLFHNDESSTHTLLSISIRRKPFSAREE